LGVVESLLKQSIEHPHKLFLTTDVARHQVDGAIIAVLGRQFEDGSFLFEQDAYF